MSEINDLELVLCLALNALTRGEYDSARSFCAQRRFQPLLLCLDEAYFGARAEPGDWEELAEALAGFGRARGLVFSLEFDVEGIAKGDFAAEISAILQLLGLASVARAARWERALEALDARQRRQLSLALEEVMGVIVPSGGSEVARLLRRLGEEETRRQELEARAARLESQLRRVAEQFSCAETVIAQKDAEIFELRRIKATALLQLEEFYAAQNSTGGQESSSKISRLNVEREALGARLAQAEAALCDALNDGERLKVQLEVAGDRRREAEAMGDTCEKLRRANEELRVELGVADSKLQLLAVGEKIAQKCQDRLRELNQENLDLKLVVTELEGKVRNFAQKAKCADDNFRFLRQSTMRTDTTVSEAGEDSKLLRGRAEKLEEQLARARAVAQQSRADAEQLVAAKMQALLAENAMLAARNRRFEAAERINTLTTLDTTAGSMPRLSIRPEQGDEGGRGRRAAEEFSEIMYAILAEHAQDVMYAAHRVLLPDAAERRRDPLRPFTLSNIIGAHGAG